MSDISTGDEPVEPPERVAKSKLSPQHSPTSWRWQWSTRLGQHEIAYLPAREVWFSRYRAAEPGGGLGGWNEPQPVRLPRPAGPRHAASIAQRYADTRRTARSGPSRTTRRHRGPG